MIGSDAADSLDFEALETSVRRQVLDLAARALEHHLNQDRGETAAGQSCSCGATARYAGLRSKLKTALGEIELQRAYYHCVQCGKGFCPRDRELGMADSSMSPALSRMVALVGSAVSFQEGSDLLGELAGVQVGPSRSNAVQSRSEKKSPATSAK